MNTSIKVQAGEVALAQLEANALVVAHGGAGPQDPQGERFQKALGSLRQFLAQVELSQEAKVITSEVARALELDPQFNAGFGGSIQADGVARLSASYMDSVLQKFSAVMNVEDVLHPSLLALKLQERNFSVLDPQGAQQLARELNLLKAIPIEPRVFRSWAKHKRELSSGRTGTIGCVCLDHWGHLSALTSTGGIGHETVGRVGDTPTIAGNYATPEIAVSCTGIGEQIMAHALAPRLAIYYQEMGDLKRALERTFGEVESRAFRFAAIAVARNAKAKTAQWAAGSLHCDLLWSHRGP